jgi:ribosome biogenesis protein ENP2
MAALKVSSLNGVQIYNCAAGKTTPQWFDEASKNKTNLKYNAGRSTSRYQPPRALRPERVLLRACVCAEFRNRIEVIQGFDMPTASTRIKVSPNQKFVCVAGVYKPRIKMFELDQLGMKFERYLVPIYPPFSAA